MQNIRLKFSVNFRTLGQIPRLERLLYWNSLPNSWGHTIMQRNFTYIHIILHICSVMLSPVVLPLREQDKVKKEVWFICLFVCINSLPSVLLADLLNFRPQLVKKFPINKALFWSQNGAPKNVSVNRLRMYHKQRIFLSLFPASFPGRSFRTKVQRSAALVKLFSGSRAWSFLLQKWRCLLQEIRYSLPWKLQQPKWIGYPGIPHYEYPHYPQLPGRNMS